MGQDHQGRFVSDGVMIDYTPGADVVGGDVVVQEQIVGIAKADIEDSALGALCIGGVFDVVKAQEAFATVGANIFWDETGNPYNGTIGSGAATATSGGNTWMGVVLETADSTDETVRIVLRFSVNLVAEAFAMADLSDVGATVYTAGMIVVANGASFAEVALTGPFNLAASGLLSLDSATVAAAGSVQGDAGAIADGFTLVSAANGTKGVKLPTAVAGGLCIVKNNGAAVLKIWPFTGDAIDALGANNEILVPAYSVRRFIAYDATTWYSDTLLAMDSATQAAAGSNQGDATAVAAGLTLVSAADGTKGVKLPSASGGEICIIKNNAAAVLKIWPNTSDAIDALGANAVMVVPAYSVRRFVAYDATTWYSDTQHALDSTTVASAGSVQGDAAAVAAGFTLASGADATKGVKLPAAGPGGYCVIKNNAAAALKIWPNTSDAIDALAADAAMTVPGWSVRAFVSYDAVTWYSDTLLSMDSATVAAAGSVQADAAALAVGFTLASAANGTKGVKLPAAAPGAICVVKNNAAAVLKIWPNTSDAIDALGANNSMSIAAYATRLLVSYDAVTWYSNTIPTGELTRAQMLEETLKVYGIPFQDLRNDDGSVMDASGGAGLFAITATGMGTGTLVIDGEAATGNTKTDILSFEFVLPPEYVSAGDVSLVVTAKESVGAATTSTTISAEVYESDGEGAVGSDLYNAFDITDVTASWQTCTAVVTAAGLQAGDRLIAYIKIVTNDGGGAVGTVAQIGKVELQLDIKG